jgi:hypothetical protein
MFLVARQRIAHESFSCWHELLLRAGWTFSTFPHNLDGFLLHFRFGLLAYPFSRRFFGGSPWCFRNLRISIFQTAMGLIPYSLGDDALCSGVSVGLSTRRIAKVVLICIYSGLCHYYRSRVRCRGI